MFYNSFRFLHLFPNLAGDDVPEHDKVGPQAIKGICKRSRFIFFEEEVTKPREPITANRNDNKPKPPAGDDARNEASNDETGSYKMQATAHGILVFGEVKRIEIPESLIFLFDGHEFISI